MHVLDISHWNKIAGGTSVQPDPYTVHFILDEHSAQTVVAGVSIFYSQQGDFTLSSCSLMNALCLSGHLEKKKQSVNITTYSGVGEPVELTLTRRKRRLDVSATIYPSVFGVG